MWYKECNCQLVHSLVSMNVKRLHEHASLRSVLAAERALIAIAQPPHIYTFVQHLQNHERNDHEEDLRISMLQPLFWAPHTPKYLVVTGISRRNGNVEDKPHWILKVVGDELPMLYAKQDSDILIVLRDLRVETFDFKSSFSTRNSAPSSNGRIFNWRPL